MLLLEQDQEKLLDEASAVVREQGRYMKRAIDNDNLRDALKHASNMICELRTSLLSPKNYYELYMQVFQELQHLAGFFGERSRHGRRMSELYESVQHAGNILPRLYLLITVGCCYIKSREARACDVLRDMTELCKGVQHPMRGLFLRFYLTQMCKDKLPDVGSEYEREGGGTLEDAFSFLLTNFVEAARLWVRLQHQGSGRERQRRERERHDLRVLVGFPLVRMSQLEGMSAAFYQQQALPKLLDHVLTCRDGMAQQYLLDCIIQVFSDECHLQTLEAFLHASLRVQPSVDLKSIFINLLNRLAAFAQASPNNLPADLNVYSLFQRYISELQQRYIVSLEEQAGSGDSALLLTKMNGSSNGISSEEQQQQVTRGGGAGAAVVDLTGLLELQQAFLSFSLSLYPERIDYVDAVLRSVSQLLSSCGCSSSSRTSRSSNSALPSDPRDFNSSSDGRRAHLSPAGVEALVEIISSPLKSISLPLLELEHFPILMSFLDEDLRKQVASSMVSAVLGAGVLLEQPSSVSRFFEFVSPLLQDSSSSDAAEGKKKKHREQQQQREEEEEQQQQRSYKREEEEEEEEDVDGSRCSSRVRGSRGESAAAAAASNFVREQQDIAKLVHLLYNADTDVHFTLLCLARQTFAEGGLRRLRYLGPPLVIAALELVPRILDRLEQHQQQQLEAVGEATAAGDNPLVTLPVVSGKKMYQFVHGTCMQLVQCDPQSALRLFLMAAESADTANLRSSMMISSSSAGGGGAAAASSYEAIVYEYLTQALVCYEEEILDSKNQYLYLLQFVGCLAGHIHTLERENYETICAKVAQHAAKLLKKPDQCRAILACSHLFWNNELFRDPRRVLECLQKCLKIADIAVQSSTAHVGLFTDILDKYIYYYERDNAEVTVDFIQNLLSLCAEHVKFALQEAGHEDEAVANFRNSVRYLKYKKETAGDTKWRAITGLDELDNAF